MEKTLLGNYGRTPDSLGKPSDCPAARPQFLARQIAIRANSRLAVDLSYMQFIACKVLEISISNCQKPAYHPVDLLLWHVCSHSQSYRYYSPAPSSSSGHFSCFDFIVWRLLLKMTLLKFLICCCKNSSTAQLELIRKTGLQ